MATFFDKILKEFGIYYTQLIVFTPIMLASFGLENKINPAACILTIAITLSVIFTLKSLISDNLLKSFFFILLITSLLIFIEIFAYTTPPYTYLFENKIIVTTYNTFLFTIIAGILRVSYKKHTKNLAVKYPDEILNAITSQVHHNRFYKSNVYYDVTMNNSREGYIWLNIRYRYTVFNRCDEASTWKIIVETYGKNFKDVFFQVNEHIIDIDNNGRVKNNRGFEIETQIPPQNQSTINSYFAIEYPNNGSEPFLTYDPTTDLTLEITNLANEIDYAIETHYESYGNNIHPIKVNNSIKYEIKSGLLPYEGFHLKWKQKTAS